jgi:hypothetical protein
MTDLVRCADCLHAVVGRGEMVRCERGGWRAAQFRPLKLVKNGNLRMCSDYEYAGDDDAD